MYKRQPKRWRNGVFTNAVLVVCAVLFIILGVYQMWDTVSDIFS